MSATEVQLAEQHFNSSSNKAEASQNLITDVETILQSAKGNVSVATTDMARLNKDLNLKDKGFPENFSIFGANGNELVLQDKNNKQHQLVFDNNGQLKFDGTPEKALEFVASTTSGEQNQKQPGDVTQDKVATVKDSGKTVGADSDADNRDYQIQKGDSLWKISKLDLPDGATPRQILEHMREIEALNPEITNPELIKAGDTLKLPAKAKDGTDDQATPAADQGKTVVDKDGNQVTTWDDGTERHQNQDGTKGYVKHADKSEEHWGPKPEDNYELTKDGTKINVTYGPDGEKIRTSPDGSKVTTWKDGVERHESADGKTGYIKQPDGYEHHWGAKPEDNYEQTSDGIKVSGAGASASKTYDDGTVKTINGDGTGSVKQSDGTEHHWGPNLTDNYDVTADGTKVSKTADGGTVKEKNGSKTTTWADGTVKSEDSDGSGYVKNADGTEHHWGPKAEQNYDLTADGGTQTKDENGNTKTVWKDGTIRIDYAIGSGKVMKPQPDGSYKVHNWYSDGSQSDDTESAQTAA